MSHILQGAITQMPNLSPFVNDGHSECFLHITWLYPDGYTMEVVRQTKKSASRTQKTQLIFADNFIDEDKQACFSFDILQKFVYFNCRPLTG